MANNYVSSSTVLQYVAPSGGITGGDVVQVGDIVGVAVSTVTAGETVSIATTGVYDIAKASVVVTHGAALYWDVDNSRVTTTATTGRMIGVAWEPATQSATTVAVQLLGRQSPSIPVVIRAEKKAAATTWAILSPIYLMSNGRISNLLADGTFVGLALEPAVASSQTHARYLHVAHLL